MNHLKNGANLKWAKKKIISTNLYSELKSKGKKSIFKLAFKPCLLVDEDIVFILLKLTPHLAVLDTKNLNALVFI